MFWDWKSIGRTLFVFFILVSGIILVFFYPDWKRKADSKNGTKSKSTEAILITVKPNESLSMTELGNKKIVHSYEVKYTYTVKGSQYVAVDIIPNSMENKQLITQLCSNRKKLNIKYDPKKPGKSIVIQ